VPTQLSPYPIRALEYVLSQVEEVGQFRETPLPIVGIAVSMYDRQSKTFNQAMVDDLNAKLDRLPGGDRTALFREATWVPRLNVLSKSQSKGYPLCAADFDEDLGSQDRNSVENALAAFENLAKELIQKVSVDAEPNP
jgi:cellulose biosynthesis protein BcsQ